MGLAVGSLLKNRYKVLKHLGRGSWGDVYLAEDRQLGRRVAIKHLRSGRAQDPESVERFLDEARTIAGIRDEHVITIYDVIEEEGGEPYLILEYADGGSVADRLQREKSLPVLDALRIGLAAARALEVVHAKGILHRDIKPSNLLLTRRDREEFRAKLTDFGLSRVVTSSEGGVTGSILYTAPEVLQEKPSDGRADLYALGAVLYEMLTGCPPFLYTGNPEEVGQVLRGHLEEEPPPPSTLNSNVSPAVDRVILKALRKDPDERYPDARTMAQALEEAIAAHRAWQERVERAYAKALEHERREEWEEAAACYEKVLEDQPGHLQAQEGLKRAKEQLDWERLYRRGLQAYDRGAWEKAEAILAQVVAYDESYAGGDAATKLKEARRQLELQRWYDEARDHEAHERWPQAVDLYLKILTQESDYKDVPSRLAYAVRQQKAQALYQKAQEHLKAEAWDEAVKTLQELEQLEPGYKDVQALLGEARRQKRLHELYTRAMEALNGGEWESAVDRFSRVLQMDPEYRDAAVKRAIAERQARLAKLYAQAQEQREAAEWAAAAETLQEIREIAPGYRDVDRLLEEVLQKQRVAELYEEAIRLEGEGRWEQAVRRLEEVRQLQPGYQDVEERLEQVRQSQRVEALYAQARQFEVEEKWAEAIATYSEILKLDPNHRDAKVGLARVSAAALGREQPDEQRERWIALGGALLVLAALACMMFIPLSRVAGVIFPSSTTPTASLVVGQVTSTPMPSATRLVAVISPSPSETPTPSPTATPTATSTPTDTATPTATPTPTPTGTPILTMTPTLPPTSTSLPWNLQTPVPSAPPNYDPNTACVITPCAPAPQLVGPPDGAEFPAGSRIELKWTWPYCLPSGWRFAIRVSRENPPHSYQYVDYGYGGGGLVVCEGGKTSGTFYIESTSAFSVDTGTYYWNIAVARHVDAPWEWERLSENSEIRSYRVVEGGGGGGEPSPPCPPICP